MQDWQGLQSRRPLADKGRRVNGTCVQRCITFRPFHDLFLYRTFADVRCTVLECVSALIYRHDPVLGPFVPTSTVTEISYGQDCP
jgi:hypothetical protein